VRMGGEKGAGQISTSTRNGIGVIIRTCTQAGATHCAIILSLARKKVPGRHRSLIRIGTELSMVSVLGKVL
jgi:hypothetical protein